VWLTVLSWDVQQYVILAIVFVYRSVSIDGNDYLAYFHLALQMSLLRKVSRLLAWHTSVYMCSVTMIRTICYSSSEPVIYWRIWTRRESLILVLCEYSKCLIESNSYFIVRFDSKRVQLFQIFEYLPSPISYFKSFFFNRMTPIFQLSNKQNQCYIGPLWPTKYWHSYNRNHNVAVP